MDEIGMFTALRPQPGPLDLSGAHGRLASAITGAPDRHRVSRRTRCAAAGGLAAAAATVTVTAVALTAGSAPPALATVTTALTRTLTQSYHLTEQDNFHLHPVVHNTCVGEVDPVRHLEATSCSNGFPYRKVGGYMYLYYPHLAGHPGRHWERIPSVPPVVTGLGAIASVTPQQMLSAIEKAAKVTVVGPVSGPGWTGTRYAISGSASGTVDVDRQGRARALTLTIRDAITPNATVQTLVLTFSDFGARVTVTPPPADQTFPIPGS